MRQTKVQKINAGGLANGWHAERLATEAKHFRVPMAQLYAKYVRESSGFSVPATATKANGNHVWYRFSDGSGIRVRNYANEFGQFPLMVTNGPNDGPVLDIREMSNVGSAKYVVNYHVSGKTHPDGSAFYDMAIFKNKKRKDSFLAELEARRVAKE